VTAPSTAAAAGEAPDAANGSDDARRRRRMAFVIGGLVVAGIVARLLVLASRDGRLAGDEAYAGLQALATWRDGDVPIVIHDAVYTAVFESFVFAPISAVMGGSLVALKVLFVVIWAGAAAATGLLTRRLAGGTAGIVAGLLVWWAPGALLVVSTLAYPGYALGMAGSVVVAILAARLLDVDRTATWRSAALLGLAAGLTFWIHPMFVATMGPVLAVVAVALRRRWRDVLLPLAAGFVVGCSPFLVWNAAHGWPSVNDRARFEGTYTDRLNAIVTDLLPRALGLKDDTLDWRWGPVIGIALYAAAIAATAAGAVVVWRRAAGPARLLVPVTLVAVVPLMAALPPLIFAADGRYAVIPLPFVAVALGAFAANLASLDGLAGRLAPAAFVVAWTLVFIAPQVADNVGTLDEDPNATYRAVADRLDEVGIDHVYGSFWQVLPVDYVADGELTAGVLPYYSIRFADEQRAVEATPPERVAFLFSTFDEDTAWLWMPPEDYVREVIGDVVLYLPLAAAAPASDPASDTGSASAVAAGG
jgi:hypothetical protein